MLLSEYLHDSGPFERVEAKRFSEFAPLVAVWRDLNKECVAERRKACEIHGRGTGRRRKRRHEFGVVRNYRSRLLWARVGARPETLVVSVEGIGDGAARGRARLRIALVAEAADTGLSTILYQLANGLALNDHEVHLLSSVERTDKEMLRRLESTSVRCVPIAMTRATGLRDVTALVAIRRYLRAHGPFDVVHGHSSKGGALARLAAAGLGLARIYTPHAFYSMSPSLTRGARKFYALTERLLAQLCDKVVASSWLEHDHARSIGIPARRLTVIENGIEAPALLVPARERFGFGEARSVVIGFVGRLEYQKGPDLLVKAFARAARRNDAIRLVVIGDGAMAPSLATLAERLGVPDRVAYLGRRPSTDYLASFDILAMPSRYEGFSLMPLEAMHAGLPIVATRVGGVAECVSEGLSGLIVPREDECALADALALLAENEGLRLAMGEAARRRAHLFTATRALQATERLYFEALAARGPARELRAPTRAPLAQRK